MGELLGKLQKAFADVATFWRGLTPGGRTALTVGGVGSLAVMALFVWRMNDVSYRPLYTGLGEAEAGAIVERLRTMDAPYRLASNGTTLLVPEERIDELRLSLASEGLPASGRLGFEIFDKSDFGATEFGEQVKFQRAVEGELERTIGALTEVKRARVHVTLPRRSIFLDRERPAKASVVIETAPGAILTPEQSRGITRLVASAVDGLNPDRVVVMDNLGRLFTRRDGDGQDLSDKQLAYRRQVEDEVVRKITETLEPRLGPGGVRANVAVDVDWDAGEQTEEILDSQPVALNAQRTEETTLESSPVGAPGAQANLPRDPEAPLEGERGFRRVSETTNYQTSRTVTRLDLARGALKRMSIAVLVDHRVEVDEENRKLVRVPREAEELETIRQLVVAAAGAVVERGDTVTVESLPFSMLEEPPSLPPPPPDPADEVLSLEWIQRFRVYIAAGVVGAFVLWLAFIFLRRANRRRRIEAERQAALEAERQRKELEEAEQVEALQRQAEEQRLLKGFKLAAPHNTKAQALKKHLEAIAADHPEAVARLIKVWIHEDDQ